MVVVEGECFSVPDAADCLTLLSCIFKSLFISKRKLNHLKHLDTVRKSAISEKVHCHDGPILLFGGVFATFRCITSQKNASSEVIADFLFLMGQNIKLFGGLPSKVQEIA